jgi:hypothetical protein
MMPTAESLARITPSFEPPAPHLVEAEPGTTAAAFFAAHAPALRHRLSAVGWLLVRGLVPEPAAAFVQAVAVLEGRWSARYGDLPAAHDAAGRRIEHLYAVTPFPPSEWILFHHEGTHTSAPPTYLAFDCVRPAPVGGETPLADGRRVWEALPPALRSTFGSQGLVYERRFVAGFDVDWRTYFGVEDRAGVEALCSRAGEAVRWATDGTPIVSTRRPAVLPDPVGGGLVFANQILLHHPACLDDEIREATCLLTPDGHPLRDVRFEDGRRIPDAWVKTILAVYGEVAVCFQWRAADVLLVDNRRTAHARRPFAGVREHYAALLTALE